jgi:hypothetical protein
MPLARPHASGKVISQSDFPFALDTNPVYAELDFGRAENRSGGNSGEESPNTTGRDAA